MIFVTLGGVVEFDFSRLIKNIDELVAEKKIDKHEIIAQIGYAKYEPKNYKWFRFVDGQDYEEIVNKADILITHGGVGTLVKAMRKGKKVIAFPRLLQYKEHLDNHQVEITSKLEMDGYIMCAMNKSELEKCLCLIDDFEPKEFISDNTCMVRIIRCFLDKNFNL